MRLSFGAALLLGFGCVAVQAQQAPAGSSGAAELLAALPPCARKCLITAVAQSTCAPGNQTCLCTNEPLQDSVTACVSVSCAIKDQLFTKNLTQTNCHAPVRDKAELYNNISIGFGVASGFFVLLRLFTKLVTLKSELGLDDWAVLVTVFAGIPSSVLNVHGLTPNGLGKDVWTLNDDQITNFGKMFWIMEILYFIQVSLVKLTLLFFYMRIFPGRDIRRLLWGTVVFNCLLGVTFSLVAAFQCQPVSFYWDKWDGLHQGTCFNVNAIGWTNAGISITLDVWMLAIPLWQLKSLKLHWKKKIGVAGMFIVGTFVTVVSVLRLQSLVSFADSRNPTWDQFDVSIWSTVEINTGIICACLPTLRLLLVKLFPKALGGTTQKSSYYVSAASQNRGKSGAKSGTKNSTQSSDGGGIMYSQSYTVEYQRDHDEAALVKLEELNPDGSPKRGARPKTATSRFSTGSF